MRETWNEWARGGFLDGGKELRDCSPWITRTVDFWEVLSSGVTNGFIESPSPDSLSSAGWHPWST